MIYETLTSELEEGEGTTEAPATPEGGEGEGDTEEKDENESSL